ncbi:MAG: HDOD domain-containing protein [Phycisphaeraceae bacterium]
MSRSPDPTRARRLELILQRVESLPTLPAVAVRLLQVTSDDDSEAREVVELVRADPALTSKVLSLCHGADRGIREPITTVDRAVVLVGFEAIRNAVLSIKVFEAFSEDRQEPDLPPAQPGEFRFDRAAFWRHSLAVAIAAELIARQHPENRTLNPSHAFVCGLLHDLGKLALEHLLPRSYQRVAELTEQHQLNIADVERRVIGLDHHTVGKRLAERWRLPHVIQDSIWLHGAPQESVPDLPHRDMVGLIGVADLLVRRQHLGYSGNYQLNEDLNQRARDAGLNPRVLNDVVSELHEQLETRAAAIGLGEHPSQQLLLESIAQANTVLARLNTQLETRRRAASGQAHALSAIVDFLDASSRPGRGVQDVLSAVASSGSNILGKGYFATLYQGGEGQPWLMNQYKPNGTVIRSQFIDPPPHAPTLSHIRDDGTETVTLTSVIPWISDHVIETVDVRRVSLLTLPCGWGTAAIVLHDRDELPQPAAVAALRHTWGSAVAAAAQHEGARRLGEQVVEANRRVAQTQHILMQNQSMARLGEMAAGAAHEMNNPLAVICGRAQLLAARLDQNTREQKDAALIAEQSDKLSDLISALRLFAEPPRPSLVDIAVTEVLDRAVALLQQRMPDAPAPHIAGVAAGQMLHTDVEHLSAALAELLINANQANSAGEIRVTATVDPLSDRFMFKVIDNGLGMDAATMEHAFDPFFSAKPAGRQPGLGLARAKRFVEGLGGEITLASQPQHGTTATISLPVTPAPLPTPSRNLHELEPDAYHASPARTGGS